MATIEEIREHAKNRRITESQQKRIDVLIEEGYTLAEARLIVLYNLGYKVDTKGVYKGPIDRK